MKRSKAFSEDGWANGETTSGGRWKQCGGTSLHFRPFANEMKGDGADRACAV